MSTKNKLNLEDKIKKLEQDTAWFESEDFALDQALERYKSLVELSKEIELELNQLENTITDLEEG